jgi:hypothetical protein
MSDSHLRFTEEEFRALFGTTAPPDDGMLTKLGRCPPLARDGQTDLPITEGQEDFVSFSSAPNRCWHRDVVKAWWSRHGVCDLNDPNTCRYSKLSDDQIDKFLKMSDEKFRRCAESVLKRCPPKCLSAVSSDVYSGTQDECVTFDEGPARDTPSLISGFAEVEGSSDVVERRETRENHTICYDSASVASLWKREDEATIPHLSKKSLIEVEACKGVSSSAKRPRKPAPKAKAATGTKITAPTLTGDEPDSSSGGVVELAATPASSSSSSSSSRSPRDEVVVDDEISRAEESKIGTSLRKELSVTSTPLAAEPATEPATDTSSTPEQGEKVMSASRKVEHVDRGRRHDSTADTDAVDVEDAPPRAKPVHGIALALPLKFAARHRPPCTADALTKFLEAALGGTLERTLPAKIPENLEVGKNGYGSELPMTLACLIWLAMQGRGADAVADYAKLPLEMRSNKLFVRACGALLGPAILSSIPEKLRNSRLLVRHLTEHCGSSDWPKLLLPDGGHPHTDVAAETWVKNFSSLSRHKRSRKLSRQALLDSGPKFLSWVRSHLRDDVGFMMDVVKTLRGEGKGQLADDLVRELRRLGGPSVVDAIETGSFDAGGPLRGRRRRRNGRAIVFEDVLP